MTFLLIGDCRRSAAFDLDQAARRSGSLGTNDAARHVFDRVEQPLGQTAARRARDRLVGSPDPVPAGATA
jgi:hypothetical protein